MSDLNQQSLEYILLRKQKVFVYKIPPREADGYRAELWKEPIWDGRLHVCGKGDLCVIRLLESSSDSLFATCIVSKDIQKTVERTVDSSRYFVIRLDDGQGRHAFVGVGFSNRNDAFDFICAVTDFHHQSSPSLSIEPENMTNFALTGAQRVKIDLKTLPAKPIKEPRSASSSASQSFIPSPPTLNSAPRKAPRTGLEDHSQSSTSTKRGKSVKEKKKKGSTTIDTTESPDAFEAAFGTTTGTKIETNEESSRSATHHRAHEIESDAVVLNRDDKSTRKQEQLSSERKLDIWDAFSDEALATWTATDQQPVANNNPFSTDSDDGN